MSRRIRGLLTRRQQSAFQKAVRALDRGFVEEKCNLAIDTALAIEERDGSPKRTALLQRNLWATLDALALHLDGRGFTGPFRDAAAAELKKLQITDPEVLEAEYGIVSRFLGPKRRLDRKRFEAIAGLAEEYRLGRHGVKNLKRRGFSFESAMATACHRPLGVLDRHRFKSPVILASKVPIAVFVGAANIATLWFGWWPVTVVTVVILVIILAAGC